MSLSLASGHKPTTHSLVVGVGVNALNDVDLAAKRPVDGG
jgi:hypothetical protein